MMGLMFIFLSLIFMSSHSNAKTHLLLRADQNNPLRLPHNSQMPNMDVSCNSNAVAVRYWFVADQVYSGIQSIALNGDVLSRSLLFPESDILSQPELNSDNEVLFSSNILMKTKGLFQLEVGETKETLLPLVEELKNAKSLTQPKWWSGDFIVRRQGSDGLYQLWHGSNKLFDVTEDKLVLIHLPQVRDQQMIVKVMKGKPGDISSNEGSVIYSFYNGKRGELFQDSKADPSSQFLSFDNSPQPTGNGGLVFFAQHKEYGRSLWHYSSQQGLMRVVQEGEQGVKKLEYFAPQGNSNGEVLFRGFDKDGLRHVFHWSRSSKKLRSVMVQGEKVDLNDGLARIMNRNGWPAFSGRPCLTNEGEIFIHGVLESVEGGVNKGSGIFQIIETD